MTNVGNPKEPIKLGNESQLFIDDYCIGELCGTRRRFHQAKKHPANPIMTPQGWEAGIQLYGNVLYDAEMGLYRMWYNADYPPRGPKNFAICHATSEDGVNWERTELNRIEDNGRVLTNAVLKGYIRGPSVFFTPDDPDPGRRYRMFLHTGGDIVGHPERKAPFTAGYSVLFSPDGFEWNPYENNPVVQGGDIASCMYDPVTKEYVAFPKIHRSDFGPVRRCVGACMSKDFTLWQSSDIILSADAVDDARVESRLERFRDLIIYDDPEYYSADMQGMTGFRCEGLRLGLIWFYDRSGERPTEVGGNDDGVLNIQLAYSRDIDPYLGWKRAGDRYDFIPCGAVGEYDGGMIFPAFRVLERDDELWFYYTGYTLTHGNWAPYAGEVHSGEPNKPLTKNLDIPYSSLNVATLRRDGFASIDALYPPGSMTTKLLTFDGEHLVINADAENGYILVELTDQEGKPIPGYSKEECLPFDRDEIRGEIQWKGGGSLTSLKGKPVYITFHMQTSRLYSFKLC